MENGNPEVLEFMGRLSEKFGARVVQVWGYARLCLCQP